MANTFSRGNERACAKSSRQNGKTKVKVLVKMSKYRLPSASAQCPVSSVQWAMDDGQWLLAIFGAGTLHNYQNKEWPKQT